MPRYTAEDIRNIALVGQSGCGKTTLVEALLVQSGTITTAGTVEKGNTVSDFDPLEKEYQHSLTSSVISIDHDNIHVNIVDTPGLPDFIGQSIAAFPAVETVAVVINAAAGVEMISRRMLQLAAERKLCRMIIINQIDAEGVNLPGLVENIRQEFGPECLPINLPTDGGKKVADCFFNPEGEADFSSVAEAHTQIIDQVVEMDEELMELYLEQGDELNPQQLHDPFEKSLREGHLVPICFTSATNGVGISELLYVLEHLMPNPMEGNPRPFMIGEGDKEKPFLVEPDPTKHVVAHVFKVAADPFVGKLGVFRIHQGTITKDSQLYIGDGRKPFKAGHLFKLQGKTQVDMSKGIPGDICAVAKVENIHLDAVLHDSHQEDYLHLKPLTFPVPVYGLAIHAKTRGDEQRLGNALHRVVEEDACLEVEHSVSNNETILHGLGELHLRLTLEKMKDRFNVEVDTQPPKISYRETISAAAEGHHRHKKQTGGAGQFGEVYLRIAPLERGAGFEFVDEVKGGVIPSGLIPAVEKGVLQAINDGVVAGYTMQDIKVTVYDGKYHAVDSKEIAFVAAGKKAFRDAVSKAKPILLEPIMVLDLAVPDETMGAVTGDISGKRGQLLGTDAMSGGMLNIKAKVPMSEISKYASELNSITGGRGSYTLEFSHYQQVPYEVQQAMATEFKPIEVED